MSTRRRLREPTRRGQPHRNYDEQSDEQEIEEPAAKKRAPSTVGYINTMLQSSNPPPSNDDLDHVRYLQTPTDIIEDGRKKSRRQIWMRKCVTLNFREYVQEVSFHVVLRFRKAVRKPGDENLPADFTVQVNDQIINPPPLQPDGQSRVNIPIIVPRHIVRSSEVHIAFKSSDFYHPGNAFEYSVEVARVVGRSTHPGTGLHYRRKKAVREHIRNSLNSEEEICATSLTLSLICPIGQKRIEVPGRSSSCTHFQCFDVVSFLVLYAGKQNKKNYCPVCHTGIWQNSLFVDQYMEEILEKSETDKVEFDGDGDWKCVVEGKIQLINADEPVIADVIDDDKSGIKPEGKKKKNDRTVVDLTESGSDASWDSDSSSESCPCDKCKKENEEKEARAKASPIFVDLTLDSE